VVPDVPRRPRRVRDEGGVPMHSLVKALWRRWTRVAHAIGTFQARLLRDGSPGRAEHLLQPEGRANHRNPRRRPEHVLTLGNGSAGPERLDRPKRVSRREDTTYAGTHA